MIQGQWVSQPHFFPIVCCDSQADILYEQWSLTSFQELNIQTPNIPSTMAKRRVHQEDGSPLMTAALSLEPIIKMMAIVSTCDFILMYFYTFVENVHSFTF